MNLKPQGSPILKTEGVSFECITEVLQFQTFEKKKLHIITNFEVLICLSREIFSFLKKNNQGFKKKIMIPG
jgi:hypothetical protein